MDLEERARAFVAALPDVSGHPHTRVHVGGTTVDAGTWARGLERGGRKILAATARRNIVIVYLDGPECWILSFDRDGRVIELTVVPGGKA